MIENASPTLEINTAESNLGDGYRRERDVGINPIRYTYSVSYVPMNIPEATALRDEILSARKDIRWTPFDQSSEKIFKARDITLDTIPPFSAQVSVTLVEYFVP